MTACTHQRPAAGEGKRLRHENGLTVVEGSYEATATASGFLFKPPASEARRFTKRIVVEVRESEPAGDWPESRSVEGTESRYRVDSRSGGSGGEERVLRAWKKDGPVWITLEETAQSEHPSDSDFETGWGLLGSARMDRDRP